MDNEYKVSKKTGAGKWWSYGSIKKNQWGNYTLGMKMTPELRQLLNETQDGQWLNFSLFESKEAGYPQKQQALGAPEVPVLSDEIPF